MLLLWYTCPTEQSVTVRASVPSLTLCCDWVVWPSNVIAVGLLQREYRFSVCISLHLLMTLRMFSCEMVLQSSESTGVILDRQDIPNEIVSECHCNTSCMEVISWRMTTFSITSQDVTSGRISSLAAMSCSSRLFSAAPRYRNCWRVVFCTSQIP